MASVTQADARPVVAAPDDDPYLWLEDVEGPRALAWVDAQSEATMARFGGPRFEQDAATLKAIFDRPDNIPYVTRRGGQLYNFWRDAAHPRGLWRRTPVDAYRAGNETWEVLLDLDDLAAAEAEDWVWQGATFLYGSLERAILRLSRGGGDAVVLRELDMRSLSFVPDGFIVPEAKGGVSWLDHDSVLLSSALGEGMATQSGYARTVRVWRRGTDPRAAPVIFEIAPERVRAEGYFDREQGEVIFLEQLDFFNTRVRIGDESGAGEVVDLPTDAWYSWHRGWLAVKPRTEWTVGGETYAGDTILGIPLAAFRAGDRAFHVLDAPSPRRSLQSFFWSGRTLIIGSLDEMRPAYDRLYPDEEWRREPITGLPDLGAVNVWSLDADVPESNGDLLANAQTPVSPSTLSLLPAELAAPVVLRHAPATFDPNGAVVTRHEAVSVDGERIPYVQSGPPGETGDAPVFMTAYGGFRISLLPTYSSVRGKLWLERGGTTVTANIRGGGEFGSWWHDGGRRERKSLSHDDFAAVAADLVRRGVTRPDRIGAEGGSNGGLLIANMLTRYPERFGALFCTIPLIDMRRYHRLLAGASWIAEYGDPDGPEDWAFMQKFSAYHVAEPGRRYPPIMLATSRKDDRVHPAHARKMAAKLQAMGYERYFYEPPAGGHGYGKDNADVARFSALGMAFLSEMIGWAVDGRGA
ncbi:MAG TPA: prolyl oligopeptidase family serine peptidase [Acetobacteraceae bacterium]|nr:prolyl oligopeptidase family serine peptidase [Acetobacteraceae bacterium]